MTLDPTTLRPATRLVQGGVRRTAHGETAEALFLTSGYVYDDAEQAEATFNGTVEHYQYSRFANPTLTMLEDRLCLIEGAEACRTTATGMAAVNAALLAHLKAGDRVVASRALFGSCHWIVSTFLPKFGIESVFVDGADLAQWRDALGKPTNLVLLETPSNPMLEIVDLPAVAEHGACRGSDRRGRQRVRDSLVAAAVDHGRGCRGVFLHQAYRRSGTRARRRDSRRAGNGSPTCCSRSSATPARRLSAFNAWLLLKGLETLPLRVDAGCRAAGSIAEFLATQSGVTRVWYPTRADHPQRELAMRQMSAGGTVVTFEVAGGKAGAFRVMNALQLIAVSNNLGDFEVAGDASGHHDAYAHRRGRAGETGITDGVIRLSVGLEDPEDIKDDLARALVASNRSTRRDQAA